MLALPNSTDRSKKRRDRSGEDTRRPTSIRSARQGFISTHKLFIFMQVWIYITDIPAFVVAICHQLMGIHGTEPTLPMVKCPDSPLLVLPKTYIRGMLR